MATVLPPPAGCALVAPAFGQVGLDLRRGGRAGLILGFTAPGRASDPATRLALGPSFLQEALRSLPAPSTLEVCRLASPRGAPVVLAIAPNVQNPEVVHVGFVELVMARRRTRSTLATVLRADLADAIQSVTR